MGSNIKYSVLMSVYYKEKAKFLQESMESIYNQTIPTDDFVLVCDGSLNSELDTIISQMENRFGDILHVVRLEKNSGTGNALNEGIKFCKHNLIARMDSDDVSFANRCERQLKVFLKNPKISIVSGTILEFQDTTDVVTGKRELPENHNTICEFSHRRNPFNHPAVMFKKEDVEAVGGYNEEFPWFEDYYLWIRMLQNGCMGYNLREPLLYMRTSNEMYMRRGGKEYASSMLKFRRWMRKNGWNNEIEYLLGVIPHIAVCMTPNIVRKAVYKKLH